MAIVRLREVDGVLMLPISADAKSGLSLTDNSVVDVQLQDGQITMQPAPTRRQLRRYKLSELLADYDQIPRDSDEDYEWLNSPPVGRELI